MRLISFKLLQTLAILSGCVFFTCVAVLGAPIFMLWSSCGLLADVWAYKPGKVGHHGS